VTLAAFLAQDLPTPIPLQIQLTVLSFLVEIYALNEAIQLQMLGPEAVALVEAILAHFASYCKVKKAKDDSLHLFEDRHGLLCQTSLDGRREGSFRENPPPVIRKLPQSDEIIIPILGYFCSFADFFAKNATCSAINLSWAILEMVPKTPDGSWVNDSELKNWHKLPDTSYQRSPNLLIELLNFLSVLQAFSPDQSKIRMAISKIRNIAFNENLFGVTTLAAAIISEFEVENQFDF
jgi:hypothetical protein